MDPWCPIFTPHKDEFDAVYRGVTPSKEDLEYVELLKKQILMYQNGYSIFPWLFFGSALFYLAIGIRWDAKENG